MVVVVMVVGSVWNKSGREVDRMTRACMCVCVCVCVRERERERERRESIGRH